MVDDIETVRLQEVLVLSTGRYGGPGGQYVVNRQSGFN